MKTETRNREIFKYSFLLNETVAVGALAPDEDTARREVLELFGFDSVLDLCSVTFHHNSTDYAAA